MNTLPHHFTTELIKPILTTYHINMINMEKKKKKISKATFKYLLVVTTRYDSLQYDPLK